MLGMIKKDLYLLSGFNSSFIVFLGLFVLLPLFTGNFTMVTVMLPIIISTISINLLAYDRQCDWDQYAAALPVDRKKTVLAHYIFNYALVLAGSVIGFALSVMISRFRSGAPSASEIFGSAAGALIGVFIYLAVITPLIYKFGVEKSRILLMLIIMFPMLGMMTFMDSSAFAAIKERINGFPAAVLLMIAVAAVCAASYYISAAIYAKKEF